MQAKNMLHQMLKESCPAMHGYRLTALMDTVEALIHGQRLTVTGLGRASLRGISMKHGIKQSDRLIGNGHLYGERCDIYQAVSQMLIGHNKRPLILIDWSDDTYDRAHQHLCASLPAGGRALTLYEAVHPLKAYGNARIQKRFLKTVQSWLPADCYPILITDAGFVGPWFRAVGKLGWDYIGRIRQNLYYRNNPEEGWIKCNTLYHEANATPRYYGEIRLVRYQPFPCHLYVYKQQSKGRHKLTKQGYSARSRHSKKNARREDSPWLLVSSLSQEEVSARQMIQLYRTRMQIEEAFRDIKNQRMGFFID